MICTHSFFLSFLSGRYHPRQLVTPLTNEELSDDKPSQFLRRIQRLLGGASDNVARQLFLRKLPLPIRTGLAPFQDRPLTEQAELADQIAALKPTTTMNAVSSDISSFASRLERLESPYMNSCNAATNRQMTTAIQKAVTITQHLTSITTNIDFSLFYGDIRKAYVIVNATNDVNDNVKIEDAAQELDLTERMASTSLSCYLFIKESASTFSLSPSTLDPTCFYHLRFGDRAQKCAPPCSWGNDTGV
ncbi:hypothetical protein T05_6398 [Trichinella murrelli]|uniref:Uncharacterized protein n=1 Tax=Trichinella murrelli TaxID=144512 RepID=A0A0V0UCE8_9BILA|nr:hypothetical protein T05_6398 [Trichinella murrelli]